MASPQRVTLGGAHPSEQALRRTLDRVAERMTRRLRPLLEPLLRCNLRIEAASCELTPYRSWLGGQPRFAGLVHLCLEPAALPLLVELPAATVHDAVTRFFGGEGGDAPQGHSEFTTAEERILLRIAAGVGAAFASELALDGAGEAVTRGHETNPIYATFAEPGETVGLLDFRIALADEAQHRFAVLLSPALLRAMEARGRGGAGEAGAGWSERLFDSAGAVHFDARVVVARPQITLSQLLALEPGDILPTIVPTVVPLIVAGRTIAHGTIGETDGRAALRIERLETKAMHP